MSGHGPPERWTTLEHHSPLAQTTSGSGGQGSRYHHSQHSNHQTHLASGNPWEYAGLSPNRIRRSNPLGTGGTQITNEAFNPSYQPPNPSHPGGYHTLSSRRSRPSMEYDEYGAPSRSPRTYGQMPFSLPRGTSGSTDTDLYSAEEGYPMSGGYHFAQMTPREREISGYTTMSRRGGRRMTRDPSSASVTDAHGYRMAAEFGGFSHADRQLLDRDLYQGYSGGTPGTTAPQTSIVLPYGGYGYGGSSNAGLGFVARDRRDRRSAPEKDYSMERMMAEGKRSQNISGIQRRTNFPSAASSAGPTTQNSRVEMSSPSASGNTSMASAFRSSRAGTEPIEKLRNIAVVKPLPHSSPKPQSLPQVPPESAVVRRPVAVQTRASSAQTQTSPWHHLGPSISASVPLLGNGADISRIDVLLRYLRQGTVTFFGLDQGAREEELRDVWTGRRQRLALRKYGSLKDGAFPPIHHHPHHAQTTAKASRTDRAISTDQPDAAAALEMDSLPSPIKRLSEKPTNKKDPVVKIAWDGLNYAIRVSQNLGGAGTGVAANDERMMFIQKSQRLDEAFVEYWSSRDEEELLSPSSTATERRRRLEASQQGFYDETDMAHTGRYPPPPEAYRDPALGDKDDEDVKEIDDDEGG
ncbi:unnamed protein product [Cyprideis torosa]|uniref:Uncharacterized protein n=1 Tax=Cyprideis torosa TaxID=163714 RepID=A0A7R8ZRJ1_9CRUS|nr:unnamed protein product [Cyprideis torosa]CAG0893221.1 unnamed protein product [Cyprideis torosa]